MDSNKKGIFHTLQYQKQQYTEWKIVFSCIADWRFREFYPCRKFHLAWGVPDESRAKQQRHFSAIYD
jgi:hypothetical protein